MEDSTITHFLLGVKISACGRKSIQFHFKIVVHTSDMLWRKRQYIKAQSTASLNTSYIVNIFVIPKIYFIG